jgi:hypothetical protein
MGPDPNNIMRLGTDIRYAMISPAKTAAVALSSSRRA